MCETIEVEIECCPTSAAVTARGPVIVYRDRVTPAGARPEDIRYDTPTVRDIHLVRLENGPRCRRMRSMADRFSISARAARPRPLSGGPTGATSGLALDGMSR
jgi:hypothetical protein